MINSENLAGLADKRAYLQVLGCLMVNPMLLDDTTKILEKEDFGTEVLYKYIFVSINNLYQQ